MGSEPCILVVDGLAVHYDSPEGVVHAVDDVSCKIQKGETVGVVGESGSGKSTLALSVLGLLPHNARIVRGSILFEDSNLLSLSEKELRETRGKEVSIVFQDPAAYLNPLMRVKDQIGEIVSKHTQLGPKEVNEKVLEALKLVRIPDPLYVADAYPHQLSGGMKQRVLIAMAIINKPALVVLDEPTSALDVTVQAQILSLLRKLKEDFGLSFLLITHNLAVAAELCDRIYVMYGGNIMEEGRTFEIFEQPIHPYTRGLLSTILRIDVDTDALMEIRGQLPSLIDPPSGCRFRPRCPSPTATCGQEPPGNNVSLTHQVRCWLTGEVRGRTVDR